MNRLRQIEQEALEQGREQTRRRLQEQLQTLVDEMGPISPHSGLKLKRARRIGLKLRTVCGEVELRVWYGFCSHSGRNLSPAREQWGLEANQRFSPEFEHRMVYTATQTGSYEKAAAMAGCWGSPVSDDGIHACVQRRGPEAACGALPPPPIPEDSFSLVLMMDGWLARHRGPQWGLKPATQLADRVHWHEIKSAVLFRLDQRAQTQSGRRMLITKHVVAAPAETKPVDFARQVHDEALRCGLARARAVYVIQDGAIWLWNVFEQRFAQCASGVLDFYHASSCLWALANELYGSGSVEGQRWVRHLLHRLRHGKERQVLRSLEHLVRDAAQQHPQSLDLITNTANYFRDHREHIHYAQLDEDQVPVGSGAMESQCAQFQDRFKRTGQFWSDRGFANLLAIDVRVRNDELHYLWAA